MKKHNAKCLQYYQIILLGWEIIKQDTTGLILILFTFCRYNLLIKAESFVDEVFLYLKQQKEIREGGFVDLFAAFAAVAGINFK